jgi:hypothetical protein
LHPLHRRDEAALVEEVALSDLDVADVLAQPRDMRVGLPSDKAPDLVAVREQMLGEIRAVLPGDAGDERSPGQRNLRRRAGSIGRESAR